MFHMGNHANARPAFWFHFVEVFEASKIGSSIRSTGFSSLFAYGVGSSNVISTGNLHGLSALLGSSEVSEEGEYGEYDNSFHGDL